MKASNAGNKPITAEKLWKLVGVLCEIQNGVFFLRRLCGKVRKIMVNLIKVSEVNYYIPVID